MTAAPKITLHRGDCLEVMDGLEEGTFDAAITDPPYHLTSIVRRFGGANASPAKFGKDGAFQALSKGFMGKEWDGGDIAFRAETWAKVLRLLKPGAHLVAFNHSRTWHRMTCAIEDAGFEVRDSILDIASSGPDWESFLSSLAPDQVKALSRALASSGGGHLAWLYGSGFPKTHHVADHLRKAGLEAEAEAWKGWSTALKPGFEPITLARKPLAESSVARQVAATGTGAIHTEAIRTPAVDDKVTASQPREAGNGWGAAPGRDLGEDRYPINVVHDGSSQAVSRFPVDQGGASTSRFFYCAKASKADRAGSPHPTVKPQSLMRWLVRMTAPRRAVILDPFGGSGSTAWAAHSEGVSCHLIERDPEYADHIARRIPTITAPPPVVHPRDVLPGQLSLLDLAAPKNPKGP